MKKNVDRNHDLIKKEIAKFIQKKYMKNAAEQLTYEYPLLAKGVIDSLSMMTILLFIEKQYDLNFYAIDVKRDDFESINTISNLVYLNLK